MRFLTWDTGILAALGLLLAYSLLLRKHKALATLVSVYIAYFVASTWGGFVAQFFTGNRVIFKSVWIQANLATWNIEATILVLVTFLLSTFLKLGGKRSRYSVIEVVLYAIATLALGVMFIISFMPTPVRDQIMATSHLVPYIYNFREWILGVPILLMVIFGIYFNED